MSQTIRAEMVASVHSVVAAVGEALQAGDTVVILESMKMEIPVLAPRKGRIVEFRVGEGDSVAEDQVVLLFEPS